MKTTVHFVTTSEMMLAMQIHELLGAGIRAARLKKGWRQQDAAARFQMYGLPTWKPVAVGQVETGVRKPSIGELLLACAALEVSVADLIPDVDEPVDLGAGATMSAAAVRALLSGRWEDFPRNPDDFAFPGERGWRAFSSRLEPCGTGSELSFSRSWTGQTLTRGPRMCTGCSCRPRMRRLTQRGASKWSPCR